MRTLEKTFNPLMQRHGPIARNITELCLIFTLYTFTLSLHASSHTIVMEFIFCTTTIFTEICRSSSWKRCTFIELFRLFSWDRCSYLQTKMVYGRHARVHGVKFQSVVLPNGLIINVEGYWESRRHDCVLRFMNWVY